MYIIYSECFLDIFQKIYAVSSTFYLLSILYFFLLSIFYYKKNKDIYPVNRKNYKKRIIREMVF